MFPQGLATASQPLRHQQGSLPSGRRPWCWNGVGGGFAAPFPCRAAIRVEKKSVAGNTAGRRIDPASINGYGGIMVRIGRTTLVWLTAIMTLIAGLPHVDCHCPNGRVKPFCLGFVSGCSSCCCRGSCCSSVPGGSCCCRTRTTQSSASGKTSPCCGGEHRSGTYAIRSACCVKSLAEAEALALSGELETGDAEGIPSTTLPSQALLPHLLAGARWLRASGPAHSLAPPQDLVTVLQRLLI